MHDGICHFVELPRRRKTREKTPKLITAVCKVNRQDKQGPEREVLFRLFRNKETQENVEEICHPGRIKSAEPDDILPSDALAHPGAMVVQVFDTAVAVLAMRRIRRLIDAALVTVSEGKITMAAGGRGH